MFDIKTKQIDWREPEIVPYEGGSVKLMVYKGKVYKSTGFQIIEKDEDRSLLIRETFFRRFPEKK